MSFADPMREALYRLDPNIDVDGYEMRLSKAIDLMGWEQLKYSSQDIRGLMQRMGTEVGRNMFGEDFWVDAALKRIPAGSKVVFTDARFPNEANAIKGLGGEVWRIVRPNVERPNDHISEISLDTYEFDRIISNDADLSKLYKLVDLELDK
jgi:hypothetical protein